MNFISNSKSLVFAQDYKKTPFETQQILLKTIQKQQTKHYDALKEQRNAQEAKKSEQEQQKIEKAKDLILRIKALKMAIAMASPAQLKALTQALKQVAAELKRLNVNEAANITAPLSSVSPSKNDESSIKTELASAVNVAENTGVDSTLTAQPNTSDESQVDESQVDDVTKISAFQMEPLSKDATNTKNIIAPKSALQKSVETVKQFLQEALTLLKQKSASLSTQQKTSNSQEIKEIEALLEETSSNQINLNSLSMPFHSQA